VTSSARSRITLERLERADEVTLTRRLEAVGQLPVDRGTHINSPRSGSPGRIRGPLTGRRHVSR
jgi:hypothetical protein